MKLTVEHVHGTRFLARAGEHAILVDGDGDSAPTAPQLFAGAVGACVLEFVANSCRLNGVPFERLSLEMANEEVSRPRRLGTLVATIRIEPEPSRAVKRRLMGVSRRATLVNTLGHPPDVLIRFPEE